MTNTFTPHQIAQMLNVSTTTLRRYEALDLIPNVPRTASNYRIYEPIHLQAFITIRSLLKAYDIPIVYEAMRKIKHKDIHNALWFVNSQQYSIQAEKHRVEEILEMIRKTDFTHYKNVKIGEYVTIGEAAKIAGVNTSAIRHWENEGLIASQRNQENGYRYYTKNELKKIIMISSLRRTVYYIENMKQLLKEIDSQSLTKAEQSFQLALQNLNNKLILQFKGIAELTKYLEFYRD